MKNKFEVARPAVAKELLVKLAETLATSRNVKPEDISVEEMIDILTKDFPSEDRAELAGKIRDIANGTIKAKTGNQTWFAKGTDYKNCWLDGYDHGQNQILLKLRDYLIKHDKLSEGEADAKILFVKTNYGDE